LELLALVSLTLASTSPAQPETLAFLATAAARSTALAPADWSASNLDRQLWDQKAAIAHSNIIRQLWVVLRQHSLRIHCRKAASEIPLPESSHSPASAGDPQETHDVCKLFGGFLILIQPF
jgi:hypothetical protein